MAASLKLIVTSKLNLQGKYDKAFKEIETLFAGLIAKDKTRDIDTRVVYIDNAASAKKAGITAVKTITRQNCKKVIDSLYKKDPPAYLMIFGAQDVFPFQELKNPTEDDDNCVPSDLPYACDAPYSLEASSYTGPTRVVGRVPDVPGKADIGYLKIVFEMLTGYTSVPAEKLSDYFAVTVDVWKISTRETLSNIFGNGTNLKFSPPSLTGYPVKELKHLAHFYNCHGSPEDTKFYGQKGNDFPTAQWSRDLKNNITPGTIVAAECCFGAELFNPHNSADKEMSIANTYFANKAIAFLGSSTIAYGPSSGQGLADVITQQFFKAVMRGASLGRAFIEARQKFLSSLGTHLEPFELKTLAQFYLLGDPSTQVVLETEAKSGTDTVENRRLNLFNKGKNLQNTMEPAKKVDVVSSKSPVKESEEVLNVFKEAGFTGNEKQAVYAINAEKTATAAKAKNITGANTGRITFKTYIQEGKIEDTNVKKGVKASVDTENVKLNLYDVLVIKQNGDKLLGWKLYSIK